MSDVSKQSKKEIVVVFDYGHGATALSARGFIGGNEGINNFNFGRLVKTYVEKFEGVKVYETRPDINDDPDYIWERPTMFSRLNPDLYISWHSNAFNGKVSGVEAIYRYDYPNESNELLKKMTETTAAILGIPNRGLKDYQMAVLGNGNNAKVKMMLEMFFHDNPVDVRAFWKYRDQLASAYASDIANYYGLKLKDLENKSTVKHVENKSDKEQTVFTWDEDHKLAYYEKNGVKQLGFHKLGGYTYYFRPENGYLVYGDFYKIGDSWYYFRKHTGTMATGWQYIEDEWYWFRPHGTMVTGIQFIDERWHYFDGNGRYKYTFTKTERIRQ